MIGGSPHATARSVWIVRGGSGPSWSGSPDMTWAQVASTVRSRTVAPALSLSAAEQQRRRWTMPNWPARTGAYPAQSESEDDGDRDSDRSRDEGVAASAGVDGVPATGERPGRSVSA